MTTATASRRHRRASGAVRRLPSGRWQARYTGPDGALRTLRTVATKAEADKELAHEVSRMARRVWRDPRLGEQPLGEWFRGWIATRGDLAPSTRALYGHLLERWVDADVPVVGGARPRVLRLGAQSLRTLGPDFAVSPRRRRAGLHTRRVGGRAGRRSSRGRWRRRACSSDDRSGRASVRCPTTGRRAAGH